MNKSFLKSGLVLISTVVLGASILPTTQVFANETQQANSVQNQSNSSVIPLDTAISSEVVSVANNYISFDNALGVFVVNSSINTVLSEEEVIQVTSQVQATNSQLQAAKIETNTETQILASDPSGIEKIVKPVSGRTARAAGVNSVTYYWNYARIKIKASSLSYALQFGFAIGSVYAAARIVQAACAIAGIGVSSIKNGVWFDYNYAIGVLCGSVGKQ